MNPALRAKAMLVDPAPEWPRIEQEDGDPVYLLSRYVAVLALVPAIFGFVGASLIGAIARNGVVVRVPLFGGIVGAIFGYAASFAIVLLLGFVIDALAPSFGGKKNFTGAFKLAVYSFTPVWLAGIFLLLPGLRFLALTGVYGIYVLSLGLPRMMKSPEPRSPLYVAVIVACACLFIYAAAAAQSAVFGTAGF
jgi:hypothetical protein